MTVYSSCVLGYSDSLCTGGAVTVYCGCVLGVQLLCILAVYWWYNDCVFWLCTGGTVTVYSSCVLGYSDSLCTGGTVILYSSCVLGYSSEVTVYSSYVPGVYQLYSS